MIAYRPIVLKVDDKIYFEMPLLKSCLADYQINLIESPLESAIPVINDYSPCVIVTGSAVVEKELMDAGLNKGLRGIVKAGTGLDNIDTAYAQDQGIMVENIPDYVQETVAEYTLNLILSLARKLYPLQHAMRKQGWVDMTPTWLGMEIHGKTIGLLGFGKIAKSVARIAHFGFQMSVLAYDPHVSAEEMASCSVQKADDLKDLLSESDIVSIHTSLNASTHNLIGVEQLSRMKPSACLINVSRGGIIDEKALLTALATHQIGGAALDVYAHEPVDINTHPVISQLAAMDNVLLSPHIAWYTSEAGERLQRSVAEKCQHILSAWRSIARQ